MYLDYFTLLRLSQSLRIITTIIIIIIIQPTQNSYYSTETIEKSR